jgi:hypothetical protein
MTSLLSTPLSILRIDLDGYSSITLGDPGDDLFTTRSRLACYLSSTVMAAIVEAVSSWYL